MLLFLQFTIHRRAHTLALGMIYETPTNQDIVAVLSKETPGQFFKTRNRSFELLGECMTKEGRQMHDWSEVGFELRGNLAQMTKLKFA